VPSSIKNREQSRDPEMHQTRKGKQWYFGMKTHVGVDSKTKIIHTAVATAANVSEVAEPGRWGCFSLCRQSCGMMEHSRSAVSEANETHIA
jgi:hypothetical protein